MNTIKSLGLAGLAAACLFAAQAFATTCPVNKDGFQTQGAPVCVAPQGDDGPNTGLQDKLDGMTTKPGDINVYDGQIKTDAFYWNVGGTGLSENRFMFEIAGNANVNSFGIFDEADKNNILQLFSGPATNGWSTQLQDLGGGHFIATYFDANGKLTMPITDAQQEAHFAGSLFGYYIDTPFGFFYSIPGMNEPGGDTYPNGMPHMVAYAGDGSTSVTIGNHTGLFMPGEYILAWEDTPWGKSDLDYNDLVVMVESVHPHQVRVPEPAALGMFGLGVLLIGGFVALRRRSCNA